MNHTPAGQIFLLAGILLLLPCFAPGQEFISRSADTLYQGSAPFYFVGANAYYLGTAAARGDTQLVSALFDQAQRLGVSVIRTWAFNDSPDSLDPAVIQSAPGRFHESGLRGMDYVVASAGRRGIRLVLPFVNSWDDFGGMNQYVRWRIQYARSADRSAGVNDATELTVVTGAHGQQYRTRLSAEFGHDSFYTDSLILVWYTGYIAALLERVNTITEVAYKNDPTILAWELANEPRSSDRTGEGVLTWAGRVARFVKQIDQRHLLGTGEEGFDTSPRPYTISGYQSQDWLFDGSAGVSFSENTRLSDIDFASIHLYPEYWNLTHSAGNVWIRDHIQIARAAGKPLVLGEFGVTLKKGATYDSWLGTILLDGAAGACVWQLLGENVSDREGFGINCRAEDDPVCMVLRTRATQFREKSRTGTLPAPALAQLLQSYPNPFNDLTTVSYWLPQDARVSLVVFNLLGERVQTLVDGFQGAGVRSEIFDGRRFPSGAYFYRLTVQRAAGEDVGSYLDTKRLLLLR